MRKTAAHILEETRLEVPLHIYTVTSYRYMLEETRVEVLLHIDTVTHLPAHASTASHPPLHAPSQVFNALHALHETKQAVLEELSAALLHGLEQARHATVRNGA